MANMLSEKPRIVNIKFTSDKEKELHAKFKADCALRQVNLNDRILELIKDSV